MYIKNLKLQFKTSSFFKGGCPEFIEGQEGFVPNLEIKY